MDTSTERSPLRLGLCVFAAVLALDILTLAPSVQPGDGPELTVAARVFGVPHPSGYPLYIALGRLFTLLPFGSIAWRMNLFAAVAGAAAAGLFAAWLLRETRSVAAAALAAAALAVSRTFWRESTSAEVYSLAALFLALLLHALPGRKDARRFLLFAFLSGLALANHLATAFILPAFGIHALRSARPSKRVATAAVFLFLLGLTPYGILPVRASLDPVWNWGNPSTLRSLVAHVSGKGYWGYLGGGGAAGRAASWALSLARELTPLAYAAVPLGIAVLARRRRGFLLPVVGGAACSLAYGFLYRIRDPEAYFLPAHLLLLVPAAFLLAGAPRRAKRGAVLVIALLLAWKVRSDFPGDRLLLDEYCTNLLAGVDRGGAIVVEGDAETFGLLHATVVRGERPDVTLWNPVLDLLPSGPALERHGPPEGARGPGWKRAALEAALRSGVSVYAVTENDEVRPGSGFRLEPWGLLYRYAREGETQPVEERRSLWERYRTAAAGNVSEDSGYLARVLASSYPLQRSRQSFLEGREEEGRALLEEALRVGEGIGPVENNVALALERAGDVPAARALYAKAERGADGRLPTLNLARLDRAEGRQDEARRRLEIVVREDPRLRYAALLEIGALELEEGDAERALESFRRASEERPWEPGPVVGMAEARLHAGDGEGARMLFARADAMRPGLARLGELRAADLLIENGRPGEAEAVYAALLEKNPADGETANRWAWLLAEEGRDLDHALRLVRSARGAEPANPSYADTEGWVLVRLGRPAEGAALLEEAARLGLSGPGVRFRLGIAHFRSGREELGRKEIEEALRDDPESPYAAEARNALEATAAARSRS